jgi:hypothetical protein
MLGLFFVESHQGILLIIQNKDPEIGFYFFIGPDVKLKK